MSQLSSVPESSLVSCRLLNSPSRPSLLPRNIPEDKRRLLSGFTTEEEVETLPKTTEKTSAQSSDKKKAKKKKKKITTTATKGGKSSPSEAPKKKKKKKKKAVRRPDDEEEDEDDEGDEAEGPETTDEGSSAGFRGGSDEEPVARTVEEFTHKRQLLAELANSHNKTRSGGTNPKTLVKIARLCIDLLALWYEITGVMSDEDVEVVSPNPIVFAWKTALSTIYPRSLVPGAVPDEEWSVSTPTDTVMLYENLATCCFLLSEHPNSAMSSGSFLGLSMRLAYRADVVQRKWIDDDRSRDKPPSCTSLGVGLVSLRSTLVYLENMLREIQPEKASIYNDGPTPDQIMEVARTRYTLHKKYLEASSLLKSWKLANGDPNGKVQADVVLLEESSMDHAVHAYLSKAAWLTHKSQDADRMKERHVDAWHLLHNVSSKHVKGPSSLVVELKNEIEKLNSVLPTISAQVPKAVLNRIDVDPLEEVPVEALEHEDLLSLNKLSKDLDYYLLALSTPAPHNK